jgi:hypothetical protein
LPEPTKRLAPLLPGHVRAVGLPVPPIATTRSPPDAAKPLPSTVPLNMTLPVAVQLSMSGQKVPAQLAENIVHKMGRRRGSEIRHSVS